MKSGAAASKTTTFAYTNRGELSQIMYPVSGATIDHTYDALQLLDTVTELGQGLIASYDYRGPGQVERRTLDANGTRSSYTKHASCRCFPRRVTQCATPEVGGCPQVEKVRHEGRPSAQI